LSKNKKVFNRKNHSTVYEAIIKMFLPKSFPKEISYPDREKQKRESTSLWGFPVLTSACRAGRYLVAFVGSSCATPRYPISIVR
jgi:hypothetical protein